MIILINGPQGSGKDTAGVMLEELLQDGGDAFIFKLAEPLKDATHYAQGLHHVSHDSYEKLKDTPHPAFGERTPRECYVAMAEGYLKPLFGQDCLGRWLARKIKSYQQNYPDAHFMVTDCGFREESETLVKEFGADKVLVLQMERPGYTYKDNRGPVDLTDIGVKTLAVPNHGSLESLRQALVEVAYELIR